MMHLPLSSWRLLFLTVLVVGACSVPQQRHVPSESPEGPGAAPAAAPAMDLERLEQLIHRQVNAYRARQELPPLAWDAALQKIAAGHSRDMAQRDFFSHASPDGVSPSERARAADYTCRKREGNRITVGIGENIFYTSHYASYRITRRGDERSVDYDWKTMADVADEVVTGWINSPGHRQNLLSTRYTTEGIGAARADDHRIYVTQNLC